jgi:hypothetical protein
MGREFVKLQNEIKTNCGEASISAACMYDTWKKMGNDFLLPYPGASSDGSVFLPGKNIIMLHSGFVNYKYN